MDNKILQKLAVITAGAALSLAMMETRPAQAATITYDFTLNVTSGPLAGNQGLGSFSYDDTEVNTAIPGGISGVGPLQGAANDRFLPTAINLSFLGRSYVLDITNRYRLLQSYLTITGGETLSTTMPITGFPPGYALSYQSPRGGKLVGERLDLLDTTCTSTTFCGPGVLIDNNSALVSITPSFLGNDTTRSSGTITYSLRSPNNFPELVPEPDPSIGTTVGLGVLGLGWLLKKSLLATSTR